MTPCYEPDNGSPASGEQTSILLFQSFGIEIGITVSDADLRTDVARTLPPGSRPIPRSSPRRSYYVTSSANGEHGVSIDDGTFRGFRTIEQLLDFLEGDIQIFVAEFATPHLFVHAGVVAVDGRAIIIPGRSFAGKSTLVTSLAKAGATYYSDEYAVLDDQGRVIPYPRRVSLRTGPHGPAGRLDFSHLAPQGPAEDHAIPIGLVALLRYDEAGGWDVHELDQLEAIMTMSEQTVAIQRRPADTFAILDKVARGATVIQGTRGGADDAVIRILELASR